jgi:predicted Zn-dependent peptidase
MLNSYTVQDVKGFYEKNFGAKRAVIYVAGKFDEEVSANAIASSFENWKEGPEILYPKVQPTSTNEIALLDRKDAPQSTIIMGIPTLTPKNPDYQALAVTNTLLGGSFGSRITQNIREDKGYTYSPYSTIQNRQGVSVWFEQADVTSEHTGASLNEISKEITRLQTEAPTEQELMGMKNYSSGIFVLQNSNPFGIIGQLNFMDQHGLPDTYLNDYVKNIYAVTPEKVKQIANDHLKYEEMTMVIVGDKKLIEKQIQTEKNRLRIQ